jgi:hypothetical protein
MENNSGMTDKQRDMVKLAIVKAHELRTLLLSAPATCAGTEEQDTLTHLRVQSFEMLVTLTALASR